MSRRIEPPDMSGDAGRRLKAGARSTRRSVAVAVVLPFYLAWQGLRAVEDVFRRASWALWSLTAHAVSWPIVVAGRLLAAAKRIFRVIDGLLVRAFRNAWASLGGWVDSALSLATRAVGRAGDAVVAVFAALPRPLGRAMGLGARALESALARLGRLLTVTLARIERLGALIVRPVAAMAVWVRRTWTFMSPTLGALARIAARAVRRASKVAAAVVSTFKRLAGMAALGRLLAGIDRAFAVVAGACGAVAAAAARMIAPVAALVGRLVKPLAATTVRILRRLVAGLSVVRRTLDTAFGRIAAVAARLRRVGGLVLAAAGRPLMAVLRTLADACRDAWRILGRGWRASCRAVNRQARALVLRPVSAAVGRIRRPFALAWRSATTAWRASASRARQARDTLAALVNDVRDTLRRP